ncbi:DMT family transporter [Shimia biformata]|uniref:DMT family transporter n=1 Tax=Shimia biformata TaxID=1294299 RepID=UPI001EF33A7C|nr:DMT family transporter [Shimia biformata]
MPPVTIYATTMLAAGIGIPVLAALNAALGQRLGAPVAASTILFCVALLVTLATLVITGGIPALAKAVDAPKHLFLAGCLVAFYVLSITFVAPHFGVGNAVFFVLLGQLISAAAIDHFGLFGAQISPLSLTRAGGIGLMAAGVWLTQQA